MPREVITLKHFKAGIGDDMFQLHCRAGTDLKPEGPVMLAITHPDYDIIKAIERLLMAASGVHVFGEEPDNGD